MHTARFCMAFSIAAFILYQVNDNVHILNGALQPIEKNQNVIEKFRKSLQKIDVSEFFPVS